MDFPSIMHLTVVCGGPSSEHDVSIRSARHVLSQLESTRYVPTVIYWTREGQWYAIEALDVFMDRGPQYCIENKQAALLYWLPGHKASPWRAVDDVERRFPVDCVFPLAHGTQGEDGCLQGVLDILGIPYIGAGVLGSAVGMAKHVVKSLWEAAGLPVAPWVTITHHTQHLWTYQQLTELWDSAIIFVKPSQQGSSIGVSRVDSQAVFDQAVQQALLFDEVVLVEKAVIGREIECSVLGNESPKVSVAGELVVTSPFYDYHAKYEDKQAAITQVPADVSPEQQTMIQALAIQAYQVANVSGMGRVDFFLDGDQCWLNEINTLPGFTDVSLFAQNWLASGVTFSDLMDELVAAALHRFEQVQQRQRRGCVPVTQLSNQ